MVYVTARHMVGGNNNEHIASVRWRDPSNGSTFENSRAEMVKFNEGGGGDRVQGTPDARVGVVDAFPKDIRTHADGQWNNNLLSLPTY